MSEIQDDLTPTDIEALTKLTRDLKKSARQLPQQHARFLVDMYYQVQNSRIRLGGQIRAAGDSVEPTGLLAWTEKTMRTLENNLKSCLGEFAAAYSVGQWLQSICGIGPVISAGLLAELNICRAPTAGQFWRFAGLDPSLKWLGKEGARKLVAEVMGSDKKATEEHLQTISKRTNRHPENIRRLLKDGRMTRITLTDVLARRPWSDSLKCLCAGKLAPSFVKVKGRDDDYYGAMYEARRTKEVIRNKAGEFADQAETFLREKNYGKETASFKFYSGQYLPGLWDRWYEVVEAPTAKIRTELREKLHTQLLNQHKPADGKGMRMLPPLHIHNRAQRYMVKLFLSHLHRVMFVDFYGKEPPKPYVFDRMEGHRHLIDPPNWPGDFKGDALKLLYER